MLNDCIWHYDPVTGNRLDRPISVRVLEVLVFYSEDEKEERPIILKTPEDDLIETMATCPRNRKMFDYENKFKDKKKRWVIVTNERV